MTAGIDSAETVFDDVSYQRSLSSLPSKLAYYERDSHFRAGVANLTTTIGASGVAVLQRHALTLLKPDAMASGRVVPMIEFLSERGFVPVLVAPVRVTRLCAHELWRYQWTAASLDRIALTEFLYKLSSCILVLWRDSEENPLVPPSVRMADLKGSPQPWERSETDLRSVLRSPNRMITFVHIPDEPADVIRDLSILQSREEQVRWLNVMRSPGSITSAIEEIVDLADDRRLFPYFNLEFDCASSLNRITKVLETEGSVGSRALDVIDESESRGVLRWRTFMDLLPEGLDINPWDLLVIGSTYLEEEDESAEKLIGESGSSGWHDGRAVFLR